MNRGGAETLLMELYRNIDRTKVQFDFLVYNYSNQPGAYDEEIHSLGGKIYNAKKRLYKEPFSYYKELKSFFSAHPEYKIVHFHQNLISGFPLSIAKKTSNPLTIAHSHSAFGTAHDLYHKLINFIGKKLINKFADFYFGCSNDALFKICGQYSNDINKYVLNNAIDRDKFRYNHEMRCEWRSVLGATDNTLILGNVARFSGEKNHKHLIKTFCEVENLHNDSLLVLVGDGPLRSQTEEFAKELGIWDKVRFLGVRSDVQDIVNSFDVFVLPSLHEGLGIVLIEAQANGLPCVISSDVIPAEADVGAGLVTRVSLDETPNKWAKACLNAGARKDSEEVKSAIINSGYDIDIVANWLQDFYITHYC